MARLELRPTGVVAGGAALARDADGRVVFVDGALPGERVVANIDEEHRDFARAHVLDVLDASADRIAPPCPNVALGCGGCGWQHVALDGQRRLKEAIVADALQRLARIADPPPMSTVVLAGGGHRTTLRLAVTGGRAAYHERASAELVPAAGCLVAHPALADLLDADFGDATDVVLRVSASSGERIAWCRPTAKRASVPGDVVVVDDRTHERGTVHEIIRGRRFRVSIRSFFQASPDAAAVLADVILGFVRGELTPGGMVADLYGGVGVFGSIVGAETGARVQCVEQSRSSVADARLNLADLAATVAKGEVARWMPDGPVDVVIADPTRSGLAKPGVRAVARAQPSTIALVSCDAASFGRDAALLVAHGYTLTALTLVDAFPHTPHVELVSRFVSHTPW